MDKKTRWFILTTIIIIVFVFSCSDWERDYPVLGQNSNSGDYLINPDTILSLLEQNNANVFLPTNETRGSDDKLLPTGSFAWTQGDFLKIANALSQYVWGEKIDDWKIYLVNFKRDCHSTSKGFDSFVAIYYKDFVSGPERRYATRQIDIFPLARQVTWGSGTSYPYPFWSDWHSVDLSNFKIIADEAFQIAESNGGAEARSRVSNNCNVLVSSPHKNKVLWSVSYYVLASFQVLINPQNGEFEIFNQFQ